MGSSSLSIQRYSRGSRAYIFPSIENGLLGYHSVSERLLFSIYLAFIALQNGGAFSSTPIGGSGAPPMLHAWSAIVPSAGMAGNLQVSTAGLGDIEHRVFFAGRRKRVNGCTDERASSLRRRRDAPVRTRRTTAWTRHSPAAASPAQDRRPRRRHCLPGRPCDQQPRRHQFVAASCWPIGVTLYHCRSPTRDPAQAPPGQHYADRTIGLIIRMR